MTDFDFFSEASARATRREAFATATVVRAERPTSAKPGAKAIVTAEGKLLGWIGGSCAEPVVVREALATLADGGARLIALSSAPLPPREGVRHFPMTCHSGGVLEIYIEPVIPSEQLVVVGRAPVARALARLGRDLGLRVVVADPQARAEDFAAADAVVATVAESRADERTAIVVATRGDYDEEAVRDALVTPARYVALVASRTRGDVLVRALVEAGVPGERLARLKYPAGLDIGARSEEEIALSILAEIVQRRARADEVATPGLAAAAPGLAAVEKEAAGRSSAEAVDLICGMTVAVTADALRADHDGATYYFCSAGCRRRFLADPAAALVRAR